jgi:hypothetical protein
VAVYGLLVVIPVLVAVVLLTREDNGEGVPSKPAAAAGHPVAQLPLAIAVVIAACKVACWVTRRIGPAVGGRRDRRGHRARPVGARHGLARLRVRPAPGRDHAPLNVLAQVGVVLFVFLAGSR